MKHLDLFSGIGGFSYALDQVVDAEHTFVEWSPFCQAVLKKHWPQSTIYGDIRKFIADAESEQNRRLQQSTVPADVGTAYQLVTGGFPCQPFSQAGRRKGTADDRYLWPEMFRVIQLTTPQWVIAENVRGLVTWNEGMVLEQVCTDLESEGYEVQPFIIPAVAVNAPHRRDRIWIVAHAALERRRTESPHIQRENESQETERPQERYAKPGSADTDASNSSDNDGGSGRECGNETAIGAHGYDQFARSSWNDNWLEVATQFCSVDDELSRRVVRLPDGSKISYPRWRKEALKAFGNAIVPAVAKQIMTAIFFVDDVV